jgi:hypothetical protein
MAENAHVGSQINPFIQEPPLSGSSCIPVNNIRNSRYCAMKDTELSLIAFIP